VAERQSHHLAANVKRLRESRGLSQQQMSRLSGIPRPTWASLESGSANPTLAVLARAAAALQVSIEELIGAPQGIPHTEGTREYLTCESGRVELSTGGEVWTLDPGDALVFRGDQRHGYRNPGRRTAVAISVVAFAPG